MGASARRQSSRVLITTCLVAFAALLSSTPLALAANGDGKTVAVCLVNSLDEPILYEYRWGTGPWSLDRIEVGEEVEHRFEVGAYEAHPQLQVRYRRSFGAQGSRTVLRATPVNDSLECEPIFASPDAGELAAQREEYLRTARERWQEAAAGADRELASALDLYFEAGRRDRAIVRVWKLGDARPVVLGRISSLRKKARPTPVSLWGEGRYLVEILEPAETTRIETLLLDAKQGSPATRIVTRLSPRPD